MAIRTPDHAWMNGELVPWDRAVVHVRTESFMIGANVFEGLRGYAGPGGQLYVFKIPEHMDRLFNSSMKIIRAEIEWTAEDLARAIRELLRANNYHEDVHIRPTVYFTTAEGFLLYDPDKMGTGCVITAVERPAGPTLWNGIHVCVSSWRRIDDQMMPPRVKAGANYLNSRYVMAEAKRMGYNAAIILNQRGKVSEGPGACVMMVRQGQVITPPVTSGILESVTRGTLIELFRREMGIDVVEREIDRSELYVADEVLFCGTGAEVQPIISIDRYPVGSGQPGPIAKGMQDLYFGIARGANPSYIQWLTAVY